MAAESLKMGGKKTNKMNNQAQKFFQNFVLGENFKH